MYVTSFKVSAAVLAVIFLITSLGVVGVNMIADAYSDGFTDGVSAVGNATQGSPARSGNGDDVSYLEPYRQTICDHSLNLREAHGYTWSLGGGYLSTVVDENGRGGTCGHKNLNFRGKYHKGCAGINYNCGRTSGHRKRKIIGEVT